MQEPPFKGYRPSIQDPNTIRSSLAMVPSTTKVSILQDYIVVLKKGNKITYLQPRLGQLSVVPKMLLFLVGLPIGSPLANPTRGVIENSATPIDS